ncbi:hypothetical protein [Pontibacter sp. G13]|uniref:hypothetical protein n=1 Tax=Pontibacter sp. G13 TaxID=3074898 RepID=UPI00288A7E4B|nr:hypothetical protein [Pontibacter sp. G13]WNJ16890.1 hypothetical protein RJD25_18655 [Pontibacter sp. G13]
MQVELSGSKSVLLLLIVMVALTARMVFPAAGYGQQIHEAEMAESGHLKYEMEIGPSEVSLTFHPVGKHALKMTVKKVGGKQYYQRTWDRPEALETSNINLDMLPLGVYVVKAQCGNAKMARVFVKK